MKKIEFLFKNTKPFSANESVNFNRKGAYYKSTAKDKFQKQIMMQMIQQKHEIFDFEAHFSPYEHFLECDISIYIPESKLMTKKGYVSKKSLDRGHFTAHRSGPVNRHARAHEF